MHSAFFLLVRIKFCELILSGVRIMNITVRAMIRARMIRSRSTTGREDRYALIGVIRARLVTVEAAHHPQERAGVFTTLQLEEEADQGKEIM